MNFEIHTLGCKVNEYESQYYADQLIQNGWNQTQPGQISDVCIINTCTVTNTAAAKSRKKIHKLKREHPQAKIVMVGCYAQSLNEQERKDMQVDVIIGASKKNEIASSILKAVSNKEYEEVDTVEDVSGFDEFESMPISSFSGQHRAFLKVEDGCNQFCSYCAIPYVRGRERSMDFTQALNTARALEKAGHKEIVLTGIHTGRYNSDGKKLADLLSALLIVTGEDVHFRISSIEINEVDDRLIELMKNNPRLNRHLHIPIQSGCNETLKRMKRPYTIEEFKERADYIRGQIEDISISTDVICGFVDESEEEFEKTVQNLSDLKFSFLHVFPYSKRDGTAAAAMKGHLHGSIIKARTSRLLALSKELRKADMERFLGQKVQVLIEKNTEDGYTGYTSQYHPVLIHSNTPLQGRLEFDIDHIQDETYIIES
jgi:threonylcarbamoyladenosine tRNA methylthiotransferase MtaB